MHFFTLFYLSLVCLQPILGAPTSAADPSASEPPVSSAVPLTSRTPTPTRTIPLQSSDSATITKTTLTETSVISSGPTSTTSAPSGGGTTCIQQCLALAASDAGCSSSQDSECTCASSGYLTDAQDCFQVQGCDLSAVTDAIQGQNAICRTLSASDSMSMTSTSSTSDSSTLSSSPTESSVTSTPFIPSQTVHENTIRTTETFIIQSGAVITVSGAVYTAGSAVTTTFTGMMGDFAGGTGVGTVGAGDGSSGSGTGVPNSGSVKSGFGSGAVAAAFSLAIGGLVGAITCLMV